MWFTNCAVKFLDTFSNLSEKITCRSQSFVLLHINRFVRNIAWFYMIRYTLHIFLDSLDRRKSVDVEKYTESLIACQYFILNLEHKTNFLYCTIYRLFYSLICDKQQKMFEAFRSIKNKYSIWYKNYSIIFY